MKAIKIINVSFSTSSMIQMYIMMIKCSHFTDEKIVFTFYDCDRNNIIVCNFNDF